MEDFTDENESGEVLSSRLAGAASSNSSATAGGGGSAEVPIPAAASAENVAASSAPSDRPPFLNPGFVDSDLVRNESFTFHVVIDTWSWTRVFCHGVMNT